MVQNIGSSTRVKEWTWLCCLNKRIIFTKENIFTTDQLYLKWCGNDLSNLAYSFQIWIGCQSEVQLKYVNVARSRTGNWMGYNFMIPFSQLKWIPISHYKC